MTPTRRPGPAVEPEDPAGPAPAVVERLRWCVHPRLYLAQLGEDEREALGEEPGVDAVVGHYLKDGAERGLRVSALFNPGWYDARLAEHGLAVPDGEASFLHWLRVGWGS